MKESDSPFPICIILITTLFKSPTGCCYSFLLSSHHSRLSALQLLSLSLPEFGSELPQHVTATTVSASQHHRFSSLGGCHGRATCPRSGRGLLQSEHPIFSRPLVAATNTLSAGGRWPWSLLTWQLCSPPPSADLPPQVHKTRDPLGAPEERSHIRGRNTELDKGLVWNEEGRRIVSLPQAARAAGRVWIKQEQRFLQ